ncbi:alpha/beta hydrolase [Leisingera sp. MMG026]|uniref:alpha/beta hydrolase n=1 Tax=Leisingera sp. MMG026 TaxID=2909982 RepID=UPI001F2668D2|nr:alpha/beta hydrolase [Leisingera sp. MMG026]MCF6433320.1 alpha/beta hydrolase [Leisingera sp. MMG026]
MQEIRVFDGEKLRASLFNAGAKRLFATFRQRVAVAGEFEDRGPVKNMTRHGYAHLHIQCRDNDWYVNSETQALSRSLKDLTKGYRDAAAMGFSMGGYGALRFSSALNLKRLIAVSPQYTIAQGAVPHDRRRKEAAAFDEALGDLIRYGRHGVKGVVLFDPFRKMDLNHALYIQAVFPDLQLCRLSCGGHPASQVIREGGSFWDLQSMLHTGPLTAARVLDLHRERRRRSQTYWRRLARVARQRGRPQLGAAADARLERLAAEQENGQ